VSHFILIIPAIIDSLFWPNTGSERKGKEYCDEPIFRCHIKTILVNQIDQVFLFCLIKDTGTIIQMMTLFVKCGRIAQPAVIRFEWVFANWLKSVIIGRQKFPSFVVRFCNKGGIRMYVISSFNLKSLKELRLLGLNSARLSWIEFRIPWSKVIG